MRRRHSLLIAAVAAAVLALAPSSAGAETIVLTGPDSTWSFTGTVADPHTQAACAADPSAPAPITEAVCPEFPIVIDGDDAHPFRYLDIYLRMSSVGPLRYSAEDYDLYLLDANGVEVDSSAFALGTESIARSYVPDGNYTIRVVPFTNVPDSTYSLSVRFRTAAN